MKRILILISICSSTTFAKVTPIATGTVELYNSARSYEVVIDGDAAEKIYNVLEATPKQLGDWTNKNSNNILCGQNKKTLKYACSVSVNESGI